MPALQSVDLCDVNTHYFVELKNITEGITEGTLASHQLHRERWQQTKGDGKSAIWQIHHSQNASNSPRDVQACSLNTDHGNFQPSNSNFTRRGIFLLPLGFSLRLMGRGFFSNNWRAYCSNQPHRRYIVSDSEKWRVAIQDEFHLYLYSLYHLLYIYPLKTASFLITASRGCIPRSHFLL